MGRVRDRLKTTALAVLNQPIVLDRLRNDIRGDTLLLGYHNVVPDEADVRGPSGSAHMR